MTGIRNAAYARASRIYTWSLAKEVFPRGIEPTDIDLFVEIGGCHLILEGKTEGSTLPVGQARASRSLLARHPVGTAVYVLVEHPSLDAVDVRTETVSSRFAYMTAAGRVVWSPVLDGSALWSFIGPTFVAEAEQGVLHPETWMAAWEHQCRPFERAER